jgi:CRISPR-associated protein (TIGR02584 family)
MRPVALCLAGMSPAVVTEFLYALSIPSHPRIIPQRVYVLTTEDAYPTLASALLGPQGAVARLRSEYRLPPATLAFGPDDLILLRGRHGEPLADN